MNNNASENGGERRRSARLAELRGPDCSLSDVTISSACGSDIAAEDKLDHEVDTRYVLCGVNLLYSITNGTRALRPQYNLRRFIYHVWQAHYFTVTPRYLHTK